MFPYKELSDCLNRDILAWHPGLGQQVLDEPGLVSDFCLDQVRLSMLRRSFYKKLAPNGIISKEMESAALSKFLAINRSISSEPFEYPVETEADAVFWDYFRDNFLKTTDFNVSDVNLDLDFIRSTFTAGPGASMNCDNDSFYTKLFASRISTSSMELLALYRAAISESDAWSFAERQRFDAFGVEIVSGNTLFFVLKNIEELRTCCTEPLVNMLIQQAIGAFLECRLKTCFGISLSTQQVHNRELALLGSLTGTFGTCDLKSASDSISWALIQRISKGTLLGLLRMSRSAATILPDGSVEPLNMISTMGNAFTFPLQTVIFACVIRSVYQMMSLDSYCPKTQFAVFGDDIIVNRHAYSFVIRCLGKLGFTVNDTKSFNSGEFRESCGLDWYSGHLVRGIYIKSLETPMELYSAVNRLNRWSASSGISLRHTVSFLLERLGPKKLLVPFSEQIDAGYQVPFEHTIPKVTSNYWFGYKRLISRARKRLVPNDQEESQKLGYRHFNAYGWEICFLGGFARGADEQLNPERMGDLGPPRRWEPPKAYITPRELPGAAHRYKVARHSIPYWDWGGPMDTLKGLNPFRFYSYGAWKRAVAVNS